MVSSDKEPARIRHARKVFGYLLDHSHLNEQGDTVYEGKFTEAFNQTGVAISHYSDIRAILLAIQAIEIVESGPAGSVVRLLTDALPEEIFAEGLTRRRHHATLILELEAEAERLRAWREQLKEVNLVEVLRNLESRVSRLEAKFGNDSDLDKRE